MTPEMEAAERIKAIRPQMIRSMDDDMIRALIADMAVIGVGRTAAKHLADLDEARSKLSDLRYWASILVAASRIAREAEAKPAPKPISARDQEIIDYAKGSRTRAQRARAVASTVTVGITASECNEWLRSLPPVPLYGED